jgi:hypothetical protein
MRYQITQLRFEDYNDAPKWDSYHTLFGSLEEARERIKRDGLDSMFEHVGDDHYIAELDGIEYTGRQFPVTA